MTDPPKQNTAWLSHVSNGYLGVIFFALPLVITNGYTNITATKSFFFCGASILLLLVVAVVWLVKLIRGRRNPIWVRRLRVDHLLDPAMLLFVGAALLSAFCSSYPADAWLGANARYQGALIILLYGLLYWVISRTYRSSQTILLCLIFGFLLVVCIGILQCFDMDLLGLHTGLSDKGKSTFLSTVGNINFYSSYLCITFPLILHGFCHATEPLGRRIYGIALVIGSFGAVLTASESFVVGTFVAFGFCFWFSLRQIETVRRFCLGMMVILGSAESFLWFYRLLGNEQIKPAELLSMLLHPITVIPLFLVFFLLFLLAKANRLRLAALKKCFLGLALGVAVSLVAALAIANTVGLGRLDEYFKFTDDWGTYRGYTWKKCWELFQSFSFKEKCFGLGPETLQNRLVNEQFVGKILDQAHNEYLQHLLTVGIFGLLAYLAMMAATVIAVVCSLRENAFAKGLLVALIAYWVQAFFNIAQPFTTPFMYLYIACIGGMLHQKTIAQPRL